MVSMYKCVLLNCIYILYGHNKYIFQRKFLFSSVSMTRHRFSGSNPGRTSTRTVFDLNRGSAEVRFAGQEISEKSDPVQVQVGQKCLWPEPTRTAATLKCTTLGFWECQALQLNVSPVHVIVDMVLRESQRDTTSPSAHPLIHGTHPLRSSRSRV